MSGGYPQTTEVKKPDGKDLFEAGPIKPEVKGKNDPSLQTYHDEAEKGDWQSFYDFIPDTNYPFLHSTDGRAPLRFLELKNFIKSDACQVEGIGRTDRLCTAIPNGPESAVCFFAFALRCVFAPLNANLSRGEFEFEFIDLPCACLIVQNRESMNEDEQLQAGLAVGTARKTKVRRILTLTPSKNQAGLFRLAPHACMRKMEPGPPAEVSPHVTVKREQLALVLHTSGTTKKPKIVPLTHANICIGGQCIKSTVQVNKNDVCNNVMPLFHIHGLIVNVLASCFSGSQITCAQGLYNSDMFWNAALKQPKATWYSAVPTMHATILAQAEDETKRNRPPKHSLKLIRNCSAALVPTVAERMEQLFGAAVMPTYAMTESMPICSNPRYGIRKTRSVGPRGGPMMGIMKGHPDNEFLPTGSEGEVVVKHGPVTAGYEFRDHMDCDPNIEAFGDGWLRTGDKGWLDHDGYLYLSGRFKEIINRGGEKISPFEIEDVMRKHDAVQDVIAFAAPHEDLGEVVGVAVVKRPKMETSIKDLRQWCLSGGLMQSKWVPEVAVFLNQIPKGPTGKPARIGLAKRLQMEPIKGPPFNINYPEL